MGQGSSAATSSGGGIGPIVPVPGPTPTPAPAPLPLQGPLTLLNSPDNNREFGDLVAVPGANIMAPVHGESGSGYVVVPWGNLFTFPDPAVAPYTVYVQGTGWNTGGIGLPLHKTGYAPLFTTDELRDAMNDLNMQTVFSEMNTGAVVFRARSAVTGQEVFVFGRTNPLTGSGDPVGRLGFYVDPVHNLTWTNVHNNPNRLVGVTHPVPPGFVLAKAYDGYTGGSS